MGKQSERFPRQPGSSPARSSPFDDRPFPRAEARKTEKKSAAGEPGGGVEAGPAETIQRKVGFEFETGIKVQDQGHDLPYDHPIYRGPSWKINADNSSMEFITNPFETKSEVTGALTSIGTYVNHLDGAFKSSTRINPLGDLALPAAKGYDAQYDQSSMGPVAAKPQVTFGVPLRNIPAFLNRARTYELKSYQPEKADDKKAAAVHLTEEQKPIKGGVGAETAGANFALKLSKGDLSPRALEDAAGFVTMVVRYLYDISSNAGLNPIEYAKAAITILARTDFASMFKVLEPAARRAFTPESIEEAAGLEAGSLTDFTLYRGGVQKQSIPKISAADWIASIKDPKARELSRLTREAVEPDQERQKLETPQPSTDQLKNKDLLSHGAIGYNSTSMGAFSLGGIDAGFVSKLPLLEFRELANQPALGWKKWGEFAEELFDLYAAGVKLDEAVAKAPAAAAPAEATLSKRKQKQKEREEKAAARNQAAAQSEASTVAPLPSEQQGGEDEEDMRSRNGWLLLAGLIVGLLGLMSAATRPE